MPRTSPRGKVSLPTFFNSEDSHCEGVITDIGMNGAYVRTDAAQKLGLHAPVLLHCHLSPLGVQGGTVVRKDEGGFAINFNEIAREQMRQLWDYLSNLLSNSSSCPYCDEKQPRAAKICHKCGWNQSFKSAEYFDYYEKKSVIGKIRHRLADLEIQQLYKVEQLVNKYRSDPEPKEEEEVDRDFVGTCGAIMEVFTLIRKVAPTDISVLITGESGTGKEMTAVAIHEKSGRSAKPFVAINCGAIPENLLESELFGHEKGSFTGAHAMKKGKFECADGGTVFLDEIGEMPLALQVKLLRFLQDRKVERVGSVTAKKVDLRVIAATNCDLKAAIAEGRFRSDLYYRLNEFTIRLPPIRERENDRIIIAKYYLDKFCREKGIMKVFSGDATSAIVAHHWPGNVREIINRVRRAIVMSSGSMITASDLDLKMTGQAQPCGNVQLSHALAQVEKERIRQALETCGNNISLTASHLGVTRQTLHRRIKLLGIRKET